MRSVVVSVLVGLMTCVAVAGDERPIDYRFSFSQAAQHRMNVEVTFTDLPDGPLQLRISRSSPGRYALHDFASAIDDVMVTTMDGTPLAVAQGQSNEWTVAEPSHNVRVRYTVSANTIDGTYAAIDDTHAHLNMPAVILWAPGLEHRPARVALVARQEGAPPWQAGTQLFPTDDPLVFTAPNFQYLMDSPIEFGRIVWRTFEAPVPSGAATPAPTIRIALHHLGTDTEADAFASGTRQIVEEARQVFGEFPPYEENTYTVLADYLPSARNDGMEHRNSTVLTSERTLATAPVKLLDAVAHEFFHGWNVERIRPRSLEPFDFARVNVSGELWFAEGVTSYYDGLLMARAGLWTLDDLLDDLGAAVSKVVTSPAVRVRSAEDMSRLAPAVDSSGDSAGAATATNYISYYTFGAALGLGFDFAIRERTGGAASLDDVMRVLWRDFGRPGGREIGSVDRPYTAADIQRAIAQVTGDKALAAALMARYVEGHEVMDYHRLLERAGLIVRERTVNVESPPQPLEIVAFETAGRTPSEAQLAFRQRWLR